MKKGHFYFISDQFYAKYDSNSELMKNSEVTNGKKVKRPCFFAFPDSKNADIFWCVPISSRTSKYHAIVSKKIQKQIDKGIKHPICDTIRFGDVMGQERAFLIQNMFPITQKYVTQPYIDRNTHNEVTLSPETENDIIKNAKKILKLSFKNPHLIFGDIHKIYNGLTQELLLQQNTSLTSTMATSPSTVLSNSSKRILLQLDAAQLTLLNQSGIPFKQEKTKQGISAIIVSVDPKDAKAAKTCISSLQQGQKKK